MPVYYTIFCGKRQEVFLMRGRRPLRPPFFSLPPRRGFAGAGAPAPTSGPTRPTPGGVFCGTAVPAPNDARGSPSALPRAGAPHEHGFAMLGAPGDFLMRRKSPKTHQEPPGSWTSGEGGLAPFDPPASALAVLVEGVQGLRHPRGARQVDRLGSSSHYRQSIPHNSVQRRLKLLSLLLYII